MCCFLPVNLRPIHWIEELTSRAYTNWRKSGMNLPDAAQNAVALQHKRKQPIPEIGKRYKQKI
jgi:hypothetical protein